MQPSMSRLIPGDLASRAAALSLATNAALMVLKIAVGLITGSVAVLSDGIDSAQDMIAAGIAFASVRIGRRPADLEHPYGHGRAETIAAAIQALMIAGGAVYIIYRAAERLADPPASIDADLGILVMLVTAVVNFAVSRYANHVARLTSSPAILSDARHLMTNVVQAFFVIAGLLLVALTDEVAFDSFVALALAVYLLWIAGQILWSAAMDTLDASLAEEDVQFIEAAIMAEGSEINGYHRLRTRRSGQHPQIDFHLILHADMTVATAHTITDRIETRMRGRWPTATILIHPEPADGRFLGPMENGTHSHGREGEEAELHDHEGT